MDILNWFVDVHLLVKINTNLVWVLVQNLTKIEYVKNLFFFFLVVVVLDVSRFINPLRCFIRRVYITT